MNSKSRYIAIGAAACLIAALLYFASRDWPANRISIDSGHRPVMGTFARIVAVAADSNTAKECIEKAFEQLHEIDLLCSVYKDDSEISRVNRDACKAIVKVSRPTFEVLQKSVKFSELTDGTFDITIGPLVDLWRQAADANSVPTNTQLAQARSKVGYDKLILDANQMSVQFAVDGMKLDAGGIAKGYAIDKAAQAMQQLGALGGMVDVGGDIRCFGIPPPGKNHWLIGLQDPNVAQTLLNQGRYLLVLKLTDAAVATSGDYRRFVLIEDKKYSHIFDTNTGRSSDKLASVTIISQNATDADALATAVSVMGAEKGLALIETLPGTEAVLIPKSEPDQKYKFIETTGAKQYISENQYQ